MKLSIIIPVYNSEKTLKDSINSVINSVNKIITDYEIICVNDGSKDNSLDILLQLAVDNKRIKVLTQSNGGAASARNLGLQNAKGDFIAFNDSDDAWTENHVSTLLEILENNKDIDCICSCHDVEKISFLPLKKVCNNTNSLFSISLQDELFKNYFSPQTSMFRRRVIDVGVSFNPCMKGSEEMFFFFHILAKFNCLFLNEKTSFSLTGKKRFGDSGLSGNLKEMEKGELFAIRNAFKEFHISKILFISAYAFSYIKYIRRICICKLRKLGGNS